MASSVHGDMLTIGLVGGMSWESSAVYYRDLNLGVQQRLGGLASPRLVMSTVDFAELTALEDAERWDQIGTLLADAGRNVERGGADFDGCLRVVVTRGGHRLLLTEPLPNTPERVRLGVVEYAPTRVLDGVKSLSYGANMLCSRIARERGFDEALLVTQHGRVLEAPTSSLFWVDAEGSINTPPLSEHILASITRRLVMEVADVREQPCTMDDLRAAGEAFLASTTREAQSIAAIEDFELPYGERTRAVGAALRLRIDQELAAG